MRTAKSLGARTGRLVLDEKTLHEGTRGELTRLDKQFEGMFINPSMTYGTIPAYAKFREEYEEEVGRGKKYPMELKGEDRLAAEGTRFGRSGRQTHDVDGLYIGVVELLEKFEEGGETADEAGSLASAILGTLGFEWV
jgi:hypothetical protein